MTTLQKLTKLGFTNIVKATSTETYNAMISQIDSNPEIADRVLEEVQEDNFPEIVCEDNHDAFLENWVEAQADRMHGDQ